MRIAAVAARLRQQRIERAALRRRKIEPDDACVGQALFKRRAGSPAKACSSTSTLHRGIRQDEQLLGDRQPPVQRHQHRAEPRAGVEQHQIVRPVQAEDRDAVAAADAEFGLQRAGRLLRCDRANAA